MEYKKELTSFPYKSMFVPTDMLTGLHSFANWLISITDIHVQQKSTVNISTNSYNPAFLHIFVDWTATESNS